jgi:hypothetical protein
VSQYGHKAGSNAGIIDALLLKAKALKLLTVEDVVKHSKLTDAQVRGYLSHLRGSDHKVQDYNYLTARPKAEKPAKVEKKVAVAEKTPAKAEKKAVVAKVEAKAEAPVKKAKVEEKAAPVAEKKTVKKAK